MGHREGRHAILRDEAIKRREWRPEGYRRGTDSPAVVGDWWSRPLRPVGVRRLEHRVVVPGR